MTQKWEQIAIALFDEKLFTYLSARVHARAMFMCEYCDESILEKLDSWRGSACDHILPRSIYPKLIEDENNQALSCKACNDLKRNWDLTESLPASKQMNFKEIEKLTPKQRQEFIGICRNHLVALRKSQMDIVSRVKQIIIEQCGVP